jgi:hypothetical protein
MSHVCPIAERTAHHYGDDVGPVRVVSAGLVVALVSLTACSDDPDRAAGGSFCELASTAGLDHVDLADPDQLAGVRSELSHLRTIAPATVRHDLSRLLDSGDPGASDDVDDLQAAAARLRRSIDDLCRGDG